MMLGRVSAGLLLTCLAVGLYATPGVARADDKQVLKALVDAKMTIAKAIDAAETFSKGKAVAAHVKLDARPPAVIVDCIVAEKCMEVPVEIKTGKAAKMEAPGKERRDAYLTKGKEIVKLLESNKMTLAKALEAAEKASTNGKALSVQPKLVGDALDLVVRCYAGTKAMDITVDARTGKATVPEETKAKNSAQQEKKVEQKKAAEKKPANNAPRTGKPTGRPTGRPSGRPTGPGR